MPFELRSRRISRYDLWVLEVLSEGPPSGARTALAGLGTELQVWPMETGPQKGPGNQRVVCLWTRPCQSSLETPPEMPRERAGLSRERGLCGEESGLPTWWWRWESLLQG